MAEPVQTQNVLEYLNSIGTLGLAFIVYALMSGRLITRREHDASVLREQKLDERLERALHIGDRAMDASDKLAQRLPAKN
jgi:hypothetical protein